MYGQPLSCTVMPRFRLALAALVLFPALGATPASAQSLWERARAAASEAIETVRKDVQRRSVAAVGTFLGDSTAAAGAATPTGPAFATGGTVLFDVETAEGAEGEVPVGVHVWGGEIARTAAGTLQVSSSGAFDVILDGPMPDAFTAEFDLEMEGAAPFVQVAVTNESGEPVGESYVVIDGESGMALGSAAGGEYVAAEIVGAAEIAVRFAVDGTDARLYLGDALVASVDDADFGSDVRLQFVVDNVTEAPVAFRAFRIAAD